jgi:putative nucleotidyltransferase with HDIG domain
VNPALPDPALPESENHIIREALLSHSANPLLTLLRLRDHYTGGHCKRVRLLARKISKQFSFSPQEADLIETAAYLHDIGKIGIPDAILRKPGPLTTEERAIMNTHSKLGWKVLEGLKGLSEVAEIVRHHHEWYNGDGYPDGLRAERISIGARIVAAVDAYDAMTSGRCYRKPLSLEHVLKELTEAKGRQFDPDVVDTLVRTLRVSERGMRETSRSGRFF